MDFVLVFLLSFCVDLVEAWYTLNVSSRKLWPTVLSSMLITAIGLVSMYLVVNELKLAPAYLLGAGAGSFTAMQVGRK